MPRTKRTYSLQPSTIRRVRELAAHYGTSQDAVVDTAVEALERAARDEADAAAWTAAAQDAEFRAETTDIATTFDEHDRWPA